MYIKDAEWSKTYVFIKEKKNVGSKGKISGKMSKFLTDTLAKMAQHIFAYFSVSEHSASFSLLQQKHLFWLRPGVPPPLFTDWVIGFFLCLPLASAIRIYNILAQKFSGSSPWCFMLLFSTFGNGIKWLQINKNRICI